MRGSRIWRRYGVDNVSGITMLINRDGTILAVSPTTEEVEGILTERLEEQKREIKSFNVPLNK